MKFNWVRAIRVAFAAAALALMTGSAYAETLTFFVKSEHKNIVSVEFYSAGTNAAWPGGGKVFTIEDDETHRYPLNCQAGEKICMGAWVRGKESIYWGVGKNQKHSCKSCCYVCGSGGETPVQVLD